MKKIQQNQQEAMTSLIILGMVSHDLQTLKELVTELPDKFAGAKLEFKTMTEKFADVLDKSIGHYIEKPKEKG